ncbi:tellurium resistance protein [Szabonella alba]|uniref:Tellurium resistance protein n=1 Tax=Szabonella alba TaxID=2804194 RepID=A0A8K0XZY9_9RHOB|nr:tellurium resistance protein [Szabonella alba]MBL4917640.1 tellurium resistance protein [Szabonella alba]
MTETAPNPPPPVPPARLRPFQRMPPAVFPTIMGLFGLGLALRRAADGGLIHPGFGEILLGAVSLLWIFAAFGYLVKVAQRPGVVMQELAALPGRTGLAAGSLGLLLLAATVLPHRPGLALILMLAGLVLHLVLALLVTLWLQRAPDEAKSVTPAWHLHFVGFIIAGLVAAPLGLTGLATGLVIGTGAVAAGIWGVSLYQLVQGRPPAPLRPLLAIHLAPASLLGLVAALAGLVSVAQVMALIGGAILLALLLAGRWITAAGFSALWGAFTFPLAAYASLLLLLGGGWVWPGLAVLAGALLLVPYVAVKVLRAWAGGGLAAKTNAATA